MKQLIARIDDSLHARLKQHAAEHGRSLNSLVVDVLEQAIADYQPRAGMRERARRSDRLVCPPGPARTPSWQEVEQATRGAGTAVSEALATDRASR